MLGKDCWQQSGSTALLHFWLQASTQQELSSLEGVKDQVAQQLFDVQEQLTTERAALTSRNNALQSDVDKLTAQHMLSLNELEATSNKLQDASLRYTEFQAAHADLGNCHAALQDSLTATGAELQTLQNSHAVLAQTSKALQTEVTQLTAELSSTQTQAEELRQSVADSNAESTQLTVELSHTHAQHTALGQAYAKSEATISALNDSLTAVQFESKSRISTITQKLQSVTEQHAAACRSVEQLNMELNDLASKRQALQAEKQAAAEALTASQAQLAAQSNTMTGQC